MQISDKTLSAWEKKGAEGEAWLVGYCDAAGELGAGELLGFRAVPGAEADKLAADTRLKQAKRTIAEQELRTKAGN